MTDPDEFLWKVSIANVGGGPYIEEVWGIRPEGVDMGCAHWPREVRTTPIEYDDVQGGYDFERALQRIAELTAELEWIALA